MNKGQSIAHFGAVNFMTFLLQEVYLGNKQLMTPGGVLLRTDLNPVSCYDYYPLCYEFKNLDGWLMLHCL
jgi:hypothetical protein